MELTPRALVLRALGVKVLTLLPVPDSVIADELELSLWNTALFANHPSGSWVTYNNHCDSEYQQVQDGEKVIYGRQSFCYTESIGAGAGQAEEGACQLGCCTVNGPRTLGMLADWGLLLLPVTPGADTPAGAVLNFFGPCVMKAQLGATALTLAQTTSYPFSPGVQIRVGVSAAANFALWVRIPAWSEETELSVNGASVAAPAGKYAKIDREWTDGDQIEVRFDFRIRCWTNRTDLVGLTTMTSDAQPPAPQTASPQPAWSSTVDGKWPAFGRRFGSEDDVLHVASGPAIGAGATTMCGWIAHSPHMKGTPGAFEDVVSPCLLSQAPRLCPQSDSGCRYLSVLGKWRRATRAVTTAGRSTCTPTTATISRAQPIRPHLAIWAAYSIRTPSRRGAQRWRTTRTGATSPPLTMARR